MSKNNTLFKLVGETESITDRETSVLNLVATVLKQLVLTDQIRTLSNEDCIDIESIQDIACEFASIRASELVKQNKVVNYHSDLEAFTCEISGNKVFILRHSNIDMALRYALENIGEISVIYNDEVIVFGGYVDDTPFWKSSDDKEIYRVQLDTKVADNFNVVYDI